MKLSPERTLALKCLLISGLVSLPVLGEVLLPLNILSTSTPIDLFRRVLYSCLPSSSEDAIGEVVSGFRLDNVVIHTSMYICLMFVEVTVLCSKAFLIVILTIHNCDGSIFHVVLLIMCCLDLMTNF